MVAIQLIQRLVYKTGDRESSPESFKRNRHEKQYFLGYSVAWYIDPVSIERTFTGLYRVCCISISAFFWYMLNLPPTEARLGKSPQRLVRYFVLLMAVVYMGLGVWLWWSANNPTTGGLIQLGPIVRRVLGSVFILYGLLRFGRGYQAHFRKTPLSDDND